MKACVIGAGVIGAGWVARFALHGWDVSIFDPSPQARASVETALANARLSLPALYDHALPPQGELIYCDDLMTALAGVSWVQESAPERLEVKQRLYRDIQAVIAPDVILASSTSGYRPSQLQEGAARPEQIIVAHPFNPVYLLPLVEIVGSDQTPDAATARATVLLQDIGMHPIVLATEIDGFIGNRLQEALWRETLWMLKDGVATTEQIDAAVTYGFGLRLAQMGQFDTYRLAGGAAGMRHFLSQFGPSLQAPLSHLMNVPVLDAALIEDIVTQSDAQSGHLGIADMERARDRNLVAILRALKQQDAAAGHLLNRYDRTLAAAPSETPAVTIERVVPSSWTDSNDHMNEAHYVELASKATDALTESCGVTTEYIKSGRSHFTAETHVRYVSELRAGDAVRVDTQVLFAEGRKLHLFHSIHGPQDQLAAEVEMLVLHVDLTTRKTVEPPEDVARRLRNLAIAHSAIPRPEGAGRALRDPAARPASQRATEKSRL
jgi:carnitine 3-dehydrogenase